MSKPKFEPIIEHKQSIVKMTMPQATRGRHRRNVHTGWVALRAHCWPARIGSSGHTHEVAPQGNERVLQRGNKNDNRYFLHQFISNYYINCHLPIYYHLLCIYCHIGTSSLTEGNSSKILGTTEKLDDFNGKAQRFGVFQVWLEDLALSYAYKALFVRKCLRINLDKYKV
jgi:hypothetical protein